MSVAAEHDVLVVGGGPGGATCAISLARSGLRVLVLEKATFPRFHIGESLLPRNWPLIQELGLEQAVRAIPHVPKLGVEFAAGDGGYVSFGFAEGLIPGSPTINVERALFDEVLLKEARAARAQVREGVGVREILSLSDGKVAVRGDDGQTYSAKYLLDCSGQNTVVGRYLGTRKPYDDRFLQRVAYFAHLDNVWRKPGEAGGYPFIVMCEEAWFWLIPLDETRTSVGMVMDAAVAKETGVAAARMLEWGIARCPAVHERLASASWDGTNDVISNFSYSCRPYAGPGYFLVGDAATFLDPIFSTGVTLAMIGAQQATQHVLKILAGKETPSKSRRQYIRFMERGTGIFFKLIRQYYHHSFRELFLNGTGPARVHGAVLSVLAGQVFPKPPWRLRWRLWLFGLFVQLNRIVPLVPRRTPFSLLAQSPLALSTKPVSAGAA